jgi:hypothetical protein
MTPPKFPLGPTLVAPYLIQFPKRIRTAAVTIDGLGPPRLRVRMTTGEMKTKAKRKAVLSQLTADSETA